LARQWLHGDYPSKRQIADRYFNAKEILQWECKTSPKMPVAVRSKPDSL
jgi:hypothetical protein